MSIVLNSNPRNGWVSQLCGQSCFAGKKRGKNVKYNHLVLKLLVIGYSLIMATSNNKIIDFNIVKKGFNADSYIKFINKLSLKDNRKTFSYSHG